MSSAPLTSTDNTTAHPSAPDNTISPNSSLADASKLTATCHCGQISIRVPHRPEYLNECLCSICFRYGVLWAYYPRDTVTITAKVTGLGMINAISQFSKGGILDGVGDGTRQYVREGPDQGGIAFHFCDRCGCVVYWVSVKLDVDDEKQGKRLEEVEMGVNARMLGLDGIEGIERRIDPGP